MTKYGKCGWPSSFRCKNDADYHGLLEAVVRELIS